MNWKFILKWVVAFTLSTVVYDLTGRFWMSLGILILLLVAWHLILDQIERRKQLKQFTKEFGTSQGTNQQKEEKT